MNCLKCDDDTESTLRKISCKECSKNLPPTAFYTLSHTGKLHKKCISCYNAKVE